MHRINLRMQWNNFVLTATAISGVKTEKSGINLTEIHE
jgi:hypothetical protein